MSTVFRWTLEEYEALAEVGERVFTDWRHPRHIESIRGYLKERGEPAKLSLEEYERHDQCRCLRRSPPSFGTNQRRNSRNEPDWRSTRRGCRSFGRVGTRVRARGKRIRVRIQNAIRLPHAESSPEPDVSWVVKRNYWQGKPGPKDILLIIEVADSSLEEDTGEKAVLYAGAGIPDYWVVNLRNRTIEVRHDPRPDGYQSVAVFSGNDELQPLACPEAVLVPATLWAPIPEVDEDCPPGFEQRPLDGSN